jgi:hypothetical protein
MLAGCGDDLAELPEVSLVPVNGEHGELSKNWWSMMQWFGASTT